MVWVIGVVVGWIMWFRAFHLDEAFRADRFPTTAGAIDVGWVELALAGVDKGDSTRKQTGHSMAPR